jgi:hypothetical protein
MARRRIEKSQLVRREWPSHSSRLKIFSKISNLWIPTCQAAGTGGRVTPLFAARKIFAGVAER